MHDKEALYQEITRKRELLQITWERLAELTGLTRTGIHLSIKNRRLKSETLLKLATVLDIDLSEYMENAEFNTPSSLSIAGKLELIKSLVSEIQDQLGYSAN